jgi:hypothetical protein
MAICGRYMVIPTWLAVVKMDCGQRQYPVVCFHCDELVLWDIFGDS